MRAVLLLVAALLTGGAAVHPGFPRSLCELNVCQCTIRSSLKCICDSKVKEIVLQSNGTEYLPDTLGSITIENCNTVRVTSRSIKGIRPLRSVTLTNIEHLKLEHESFFWDTTKNLESYPEPGVDVTISNTKIPVLPEAFKGHFNSIHLNNVTINYVSALAFADIAKMEKIQLTNCHIENIESQAFKKFIVNSFVIEGGYIGTLPSYTMNSIQVLNDLKLENVNFHSIRTTAFRITEPKIFRLRSSRIKLLEGEAFQIITKGNIFIDDNIIEEIHTGAFVGIYPDPRYVAYSGIQELVFENNTLMKFDENSLLFNTSGIKPTIDRVVLSKACTCNDIKTWSTKLVKYTSGTIPDFSKQIWCGKGKADSVVYDYGKKYCVSHSSKIPVITLLLIGILILLICICSLGFWIFRRRSKRYMNVPTRDNNRLSVLSSTSNHIIVFPSKIYKETELQVMTESVEPIKEYIPPQAITQPI